MPSALSAPDRSAAVIAWKSPRSRRPAPWPAPVHGRGEPQFRVHQPLKTVAEHGMREEMPAQDALDVQARVLDVRHEVIPEHGRVMTLPRPHQAFGLDLQGWVLWNRRLGGEPAGAYAAPRAAASPQSRLNVPTRVSGVLRRDVGPVQEPGAETEEAVVSPSGCRVGLGGFEPGCPGPVAAAETAARRARPRGVDMLATRLPAAPVTGRQQLAGAPGGRQEVRSGLAVTGRLPRRWRRHPTRSTHPMDPRQRSLLELNLAVLLWGGTALFAKWIALPPFQITALRSVVAALALFGVLRWQGTRIRTTSWRDYGLLFAGGVAMAAHWVTYFQAIQVSTVAIGYPRAAYLPR